MNPAHDLTAELEALHSQAFGWSLHCCHGDHQRAEDVLQNAYVKWIQGAAVFQGSSSVKTWWFGVIRFTALEEFRRQRFRESTAAKFLRFFLPFAEESPAFSPAPLVGVEQDETTENLQRCLRQLPPRQAEILHLVFYQDLTVSEAAKLMGISPGSAAQHYERGKARLRSLLTPGSTD